MFALRTLHTVAPENARATQVALASAEYPSGTSSAVLEEHLKEDENRRDLHFLERFFYIIHKIRFLIREEIWTSTTATKKRRNKKIKQKKKGWNHSKNKLTGKNREPKKCPKFAFLNLCFGNAITARVRVPDAKVISAVSVLTAVLSSKSNIVSEPFLLRKW